MSDSVSVFLGIPWVGFHNMNLSKTNTSFNITSVSNSYDFTSFMKSEDCLWLSFLSMILTVRAFTLYLVILD